MREVRSIFFDLDGVLIDSFQDVADSLNFVLSSRGLPEKSYDDIRKIFGYGLAHLLAEGMGTRDETIIAAATELFEGRYQEACLRKTKLFPQVTEILVHYNEKNLAVITNKPEHFARYILKEFKIAGYFCDILGPESVKYHKPHPEALTTLLAKYQTDRGQAVMVGDSAVDIYAGKAAGVITCGVTYGFGNSPELLEANPDYIIEAITGLKEIFA